MVKFLNFTIYSDSTCFFQYKVLLFTRVLSARKRLFLLYWGTIFYRKNRVVDENIVRFRILLSCICHEFPFDKGRWRVLWTYSDWKLVQTLKSAFSVMNHKQFTEFLFMHASMTFRFISLRFFRLLVLY